MDVIEEMIHKALRDDTTATVGIRALLVGSATPYGVYKSFLPENLDFTGGKKYITHSYLTGDYDSSFPSNSHNYSTQPLEELYQITVWGGDATTSNDKIHARIRYLLQGKHSVTEPTTDAEVHDIKGEYRGPELYDEKYQIYYKISRYRIYLNDTTITDY